MINLLPTTLKQEYGYARRNRRLLRWINAFFFGLLGLVALAIGGQMYMNHFSTNYNQRITSLNKQLAQQDYTSIEKQVGSISNNLHLMLAVLSREVLFSELLTKLSNVIPKNAVLTQLSIQQTTGGIDLSAQTTDYSTATQLQVNLADPANQIFAKADIVSISCVSAASQPAGTDDITKNYPCVVNIRALFAEKNPFLFINDTGKASS